MNLQAAMTTNSARSVLIVDDEDSIRHSLSGVFKDEGFAVQVAEDGESALNAIQISRPDVVLLDIWMPGLDGLETLSRIREIDPSLPVIMISGHATIATAVKATRMGARDFIEKPLDLEATLLAVSRALQSPEEMMNEFSDDSPRADTDNVFAIGEAVIAGITPIVFTKKAMLGERIQQKTLSKNAIMYGQGLHSGRKSGLMLQPLPPNTGIHFVGVSERTVVPAHVDYVDSTGWATRLKLGDTQVATIEHLMSALNAYGICNLLIKCNGEVPVLDGSSKDFCALIEDTGLENQDGEWNTIEIKKPLSVSRGKESITLTPHDSFEIDYTLSYPAPIGEQHMCFTLGDVETYKREIAPARTFGFVKDISYLQKQGLALGGRFDNFVLIGEHGPINTEFRFSNEPVRHKILDAIGDLYLLGRPIRGKITARMTGHSDNIDLLKQLSHAMEDELRG